MTDIMQPSATLSSYPHLLVSPSLNLQTISSKRAWVMGDINIPPTFAYLVHTELSEHHDTDVTNHRNNQTIE